jgi:hypothetical protein
MSILDTSGVESGSRFAKATAGRPASATPNLRSGVESGSRFRYRILRSSGVESGSRFRYPNLRSGTGNPFRIFPRSGAGNPFRIFRSILRPGAGRFR